MDTTSAAPAQPSSSARVRDVLKDPKELWQLVRDSVSAWIDDFAPSMGAAISYYTVFSIAPLLLIVIAVAGLVLGREAASGQIFAQLQGLLGRTEPRQSRAWSKAQACPTRAFWRRRLAW